MPKYYTYQARTNYKKSMIQEFMIKKFIAKLYQTKLVGNLLGIYCNTYCSMDWVANHLDQEFIAKLYQPKLV